MKMLRAKIAKLAAAVLTALVVAGTASAAPITALDYSGAVSGGPGVAFELTAGGVFQTVGGAALASFLNWSPTLPVVDAVGKIRLTNVHLTGTASSPFAGVYQEATTGGLLEALDASNNLLLSVTFTSGVLQTTAVGTGSHLTVSTATFGGSLAPYFVNNSATESLSLVGFTPSGISGGQLVAGSGTGNGLVGGNTVPEPTTMLLLGTGLLGAVRARRRAIA